MEQQRTITKLRSLKLGIMLYLLLFLYGLVMTVFVELKQESIVLSMRNKATEVLSVKYKNDMSQAIKVCNDAFDYMKKSGESAMLFSIIGLVFALYFIRMTIHQRTKVIVLLLFGLGTSMIVAYFLSVSILLPKSVSVIAVKNYMSWLYYPGYLLMGFSGLLFVYHSFKRIVVEE